MTHRKSVKAYKIQERRKKSVNTPPQPNGGGVKRKQAGHPMGESRALWEYVIVGGHTRKILERIKNESIPAKGDATVSVLADPPLNI